MINGVRKVRTPALYSVDCWAVLVRSGVLYHAPANEVAIQLSSQNSTELLQKTCYKIP